MMSFSAQVKNEIARLEMKGGDERARLSALVQVSGTLTVARPCRLVTETENAAVARALVKVLKTRYGAEIQLVVKKKPNLRKNRVYCVCLDADVMDILRDLGIFTAKGLREIPLARIVLTDNNARAYLCGAFMAAGSISTPAKTSYHLEIRAANKAHASFLCDLMNRFNLTAKITQRRGKALVYIKAADKIADFLRCIGADEALLKYEDIRIQRDFTNAITRLNNCDVANEVKAQAAAAEQLADIETLTSGGGIDKLDQKLRDVVTLRRDNPESSLNELCAAYEKKTGVRVSKSGMKHRFMRLHEAAERVRGHG